MTPAWGIYVHIPWCRVQCPYCAFHVVSDGTEPPADLFVECALQEIERRRADYPGSAATLYLGGGTPSRLPSSAITRLIAAAPLGKDAEITVEANPEDVTERWCEDIIDAGVTRVSLGVQSLQTHVSRRLGRGHTSRVAQTAIQRIRHAPLTSWSVDLIFGVPGQSLEDLERDLDALLMFEPPHLSAYGLTIEPGTRFANAVRRKRMTPVEDDDWRAQYDRLVSALQSAGLERYEVSNFARPGHESRHNRSHWQDTPYMGVGPSAHGLRPDGARYINEANTTRYLQQRGPTETIEFPSVWQAAVDYLTSSIRTREGVDLDYLSRRHGHAPHAAVLDALIQQQWIMRDPQRLWLTDQGVPLADAIASRLVDNLAPQKG
jgi:oxygen-independent coproporphyrinogen-3 oxidase